MELKISAKDAIDYGLQPKWRWVKLFAPIQHWAMTKLGYRSPLHEMRAAPIARSGPPRCSTCFELAGKCDCR